jgi:MerR family transcriptional regulator, light-induced transcriptional regulator
MTSDVVLSEYVAGLRAGDRRRAIGAITDGRAKGLDLRTLYLSVLQPALREVGRLWECGEMTVAQEHLATAITQTVMSRLAIEQPLPSAEGPTVIAACVDAERHALGLRMLCDLLELEGWTAIYLGATVPARDLIKMIAERRPRALALSVSLTPHLLAVRAAINEVRALGDPQPIVVVGGRAITTPEVAERIGADFTAGDAGDAVDQLQRRLQ